MFFQDRVGVRETVGYLTVVVPTLTIVWSENQVHMCSSVTDRLSATYWCQDIKVQEGRN